MNNKELASALRKVTSTLHKTLRKHSSAIGTFSMTEIECIALLRHNGQLLPSELATRTRVKTQSMSQILNKLDELGIIKRTPSKEDGRKVYISLSAPGKHLVEKTMDERDEWLKGHIKTKLTDREKEILEKALPVLNKLTEIE